MATRIVVIYNPRSSKAALIEKEVLLPLKNSERKLEIFNVRKTNVDDNAKRLAKILRKEDIVIAAGGDGTATIGLNGAMLCEKKVKFAVLPYGNFNDTARMLRLRKLDQILNTKKVQKLYPMELKIDDQHFRYAACYFTIGMFAESTEIFDQPAMRKKLRKDQPNLVLSIRELIGWWRKNRKRQFLPKDLMATDILAVNGRTMAKIMRGDPELAFLEKGFLASKQNLAGWFQIGWFMLRSILFRVPGKVAQDLKVEFPEEFEVEIQAEGEYVRKKCRKVEIVKPGKAIEVITR